MSIQATVAATAETFAEDAPHSAIPDRFLGPIKVQGATERIVRQPASPHHETVMRDADALLGEIEEALEMRAPPKKLLLSLLSRAADLSKVLLGKAIMAREGAA